MIYRYFTAQAPTPEKPQKSELEQRLENINPDEMSPREALDALYALNRRTLNLRTATPCIQYTNQLKSKYLKRKTSIRVKPFQEISF